MGRKEENKVKGSQRHIYNKPSLQSDIVNKDELVGCSRNLDTNPRIIQQHQRS